MTTTQYRITGMTCGHCERAVQEEVSRLPGVGQVQADAGSGLLEVTTTDGPPSTDAIRAAVAEAGYEVVSSG